MYAKITAADDDARAVGVDNYGTTPTAQNLSTDDAWAWGGDMDSELSAGARAAFVVANGQKIAAGGTWTAPANPNGVYTQYLYVACDTGKTADLRIGA